MSGFIGYLSLTDSRALNTLIILAAFLVLAKAVDLLVNKVLRRLTKYTRTGIDDKIIDATHRPAFFTVLTIGALQAVSYAGPSERVEFYFDGALYSLLVLAWGIAVSKVGNILVEKAFAKVADITGLGKDVIPLVENLWKVIIVVLGLTVLSAVWKINVTPVLASAGIVGVAVALAAKDTLSNFFGGVSIFIDRPYKIGDYIVLESGERGEVINIGIRSTRIKTRDDIQITVPNSIIANTKIINESAPVPNFRVRIPVGVAYGSDIDLVEKILFTVASGNDNVLKEPQPRVRFRQFGDSSLNFELLCWAKEPSMRGLTVHELNRDIYRAFDEAGVRIPFPQRDVHLFRET
jgi:MscS family membrane protein